MSRVINRFLVYKTVLSFNRNLKKYGFSYVNEEYLIKDILPPLRDLTETDLDYIKEILKMVEDTCLLFFNEARCLHRSVSAYHIFRKKQLPIDLVIGVSKKPFISHAWLEFNGQVINDAPEFVEKLSVQFNTFNLRRE